MIPGIRELALRGNGLRAYLNALTDEELGQLFGEAQLRTVQALERLSPPELFWFIFPAEGGFEPVAAGDTVIDFVNAKYASPNDKGALNIDPAVAARLQSFSLYADSVVTVTMTPGIGSFPLSPNAYMHGVARKVESIKLKADAPYLLWLIAGTAPEPPLVWASMMGQYRHSTTTLTKTNAAGIADDLTPIPFTVRHGAKELDTATYGQTHIWCLALGHKIFLIRNMAPTGSGLNAEVQLFGAITRNIAAVTGYAPDPDTGGAPVLVPEASPGPFTVLESNIGWGVVQLRGRVHAAHPPGTQVPLVIEYVGLAPYGRR